MTKADEKKGGWFSTITGLISSIAALITAFSGLLVILIQNDVIEIKKRKTTEAVATEKNDGNGSESAVNTDAALNEEAGDQALPPLYPIVYPEYDIDDEPEDVDRLTSLLRSCENENMESCMDAGDLSHFMGYRETTFSVYSKACEFGDVIACTNAASIIFEDERDPYPDDDWRISIDIKKYYRLGCKLDDPMSCERLSD